MRKLLIILLGMAGLTSAVHAQNLLMNADAEMGSLDGWTVESGSPESAGDCGGELGLLTTVDSGDFSFSMSTCGSSGGSLTDGLEDTSYSAQISQQVDVSGCNVTTSLGELTGGTYRFSTRFLYGEDDQASYGLSFYDDSGSALESMNATRSGTPLVFSDGSIEGLIPAGASTATVMLGGEGTSGEDRPVTWHDNAALELNTCVAAVAVTSGKTSCTGGNELSAGHLNLTSSCDGANGTPYFAIMGRSPSGERVFIKFDGAMFIETQLGLLDGTGSGEVESFPYTGKAGPGSYIFIKSKKPRITAHCLFTPFPDTGTTVSITESDWYLNDYWHAHCEGADGSMLEGMWPIPMGAFNALGGKGKKQDRGLFWIGPFEFPLTRGSSHTFQN